MILFYKRIERCGLTGEKKKKKKDGSGIIGGNECQSPLQLDIKL